MASSVPRYCSVPPWARRFAARYRGELALEPVAAGTGEDQRVGGSAPARQGHPDLAPVGCQAHGQALGAGMAADGDGQRPSADLDHRVFGRAAQPVDHAGCSHSTTWFSRSPGLALRHDLAGHARSGRDHRLAAAGQQVMPFGQRAVLGAAAIGAGFGQPRHGVDQLQRQPQAVGHEGLPVPVVGTARGLGVEQLAGDVGVVNFTRVFVLELMEAAMPAPVAQGFPLLAVEVGKRAFPEAVPQCTHLASSAAIAVPSSTVSTGKSAIGSPLRPIRYAAEEWLTRYPPSSLASPFST